MNTTLSQAIFQWIFNSITNRIRLVLSRLVLISLMIAINPLCSAADDLDPRSELSSNHSLDLARDSANLAIGVQLGDSNTLYLAQSGEFNLTDSFQQGIDNRSLIQQFGVNNLVYASQLGDGNEALLTQAGYENSILLTQIGTANLAQIMQTGENNNAQVFQNGFSNQVVIEQYGNGLNSKVTQTGNNNFTTITQYN